MLTTSFGPLLLALVTTIGALQVTPNSQCSSVCLDDGSKTASDATGSNTFTTDIVCQDREYDETEVGRKYRSCMTCLQRSATSSTGENDQEWFIYNLRFAVSYCVYDPSNSTANACSSQTSCGPLQKALYHGSLDSSKPTWGYCSAEEHVFLGPDLQKCIGCLRETVDRKLLANFIVGLQAGCIQRPSSRVLIGIDGDIFSTAPAEMANGGVAPSSLTTSTPKKGLSQGATIGIAVGVSVSALILVVLAVLCLHKGWHKRWQKRPFRSKMDRLHSPLDARFGSTNITSPNNGTYGNPYSTPKVDVKQITTSAFGPKDSPVVGQPPASKASRSRFGLGAAESEKPIRLQTQTHTRNSPSYPGATLPIHPAYNPNLQPHTSPTPISATSTVASLPFPTMSSPPASHSRSNSGESSQNYASNMHSSKPRRQEGVVPFYPSTSSPPADFTPSPPLRAPSRSNQRARSRSRSTSRSRSKGPSRSESVMRDRSTALVGVGGANASSQENPIVRRISGPIVHVKHGARLDFDKAERDRVERVKRERWYDETVTPISDEVQVGAEEDSPNRSDGEEMWPGHY